MYAKIHVFFWHTNREVKCEGIQGIRRLAKHHAEVLITQLHTVTLAIIGEVCCATLIMCLLMVIFAMWATIQLWIHGFALSTGNFAVICWFAFNSYFAGQEPSITSFSFRYLLSWRHVHNSRQAHGQCEYSKLPIGRRFFIHDCPVS